MRDLIVILALLIYATKAWAAPGDLDWSYGVNGMVQTQIATANFMFRGAFQSDGKYVMVGSRSQANTMEDFYVLRFNIDGTADNSFGVGGAVLIPIGPRDDRAISVAIQDDGKIVVAGDSRTTTNDDVVAVVRLNSDGTIDNSFGEEGTFIFAGSNADDRVGAVKINHDGKIVVAGHGNYSNSLNFSLIRLNTDGTLDKSFGNGGHAFTQFPSGASTSSDIVFQVDGKLIVVGTVGIGGQFINHVFAFAKYLPDGAPDTSFGIDGVKEVDVRNSAAQQNAADRVVIGPGGSIIAVGYSNGGFGRGLDIAATRLDPNGNLDTSFGSNGFFIQELPGEGDDFGFTSLIQKNGKILIGGRIEAGFTQDFILIRLHPDGSYDRQFGVGGIRHVTRPILDPESIHDLWETADGKIMAAGFSRFAAAFALFRDSGTRLWDIDGDNRADVSVFRPNSQPTAQWWFLRSSDSGTRGLAFGSSTDVPVAADFTGDGKTDVAFWRPSSGEWFILRSEDDSFFAFPFGSNGDIPAPGDFDGDGKADPAVYRPSSGTWFIVRSSDGGLSVIPFGVAADQPIVADYDGDGKDDVGVYRAPDNQFWLLRSTDGVKAFQFGAPGDRTAVGDWTGDGKADVAFFRSSTSEWYVIRSEDDSFFAFPWGATGDIPSPGDFDGDGKFDPAVWRPSDRTWYIFGTTSGFEAVQFGSPGDVPLPSSVSVQ